MSKRKPMEDEFEERQRSIDALKRKINRLAGYPVPMAVSKNCPAEVEEKFLKSVLAFEEAEEISPFTMLSESGLQMPDPESIKDADIGRCLCELIRGMALLGMYLYNTDHLSDRELYNNLWMDLLKEPTTLMPDNPYFACHLDIIGGGSEDDLQIYLKYYADEEERLRWAKDWPDLIVPPHEQPPYDRDRHLPHPPCWNPRGEGDEHRKA